MKIYPIKIPTIPSGQVYTFTTQFGVEYEVRFARKKDDILYVIIAFSVLNDEYEDDEYALTNKGDIFQVMNTISAIIKIYIAEHMHVRVFEFTGVNKPGENHETSQRSLLYMRYLPRIFGKDWTVSKDHNKFIVRRKNN
ncbi:MAG: hypothetical protein ACWA41_00075 [Putridiphycobacter sp.]